MVYTGILLILAALPIILIMLFVYHKDQNKEPVRILVKLFLSGILSCFIVLSISKVMKIFFPFMNNTKTFIDLLLYAFIGVALIEELCKWLMTYIVAYNQRSFDEMYDGIVYATFVSLGFAFLENIFYVIKTSSINTALLRAVSAVPSHVCDAIFMGYYLSIAKLYAIRKNKELEKKNIILSLVIPILLHGIYDFCLMSNQKMLTLMFIVFVIILYILSIKKLKKLSKNNKKIQFKNKFCHQCGKAVTGEYCAKCGARQE